MKKRKEEEESHDPEKKPKTSSISIFSRFACGVPVAGKYGRKQRETILTMEISISVSNDTLMYFKAIPSFEGPPTSYQFQRSEWSTLNSIFQTTLSQPRIHDLDSFFQQLHAGQFTLKHIRHWNSTVQSFQPNHGDIIALNLDVKYSLSDTLKEEGCAKFSKLKNWWQNLI